MQFDYIPKVNAEERLGYITDSDAFYRFVDEYNIIGVHWSQPTSISAEYFVRLLTEGSSARAREREDLGWGKSDEYCDEMMEYYTPLLDHGAMWKMANGGVVCTVMPYGNEESVLNAFKSMTKQYHFPEGIKIRFMDNKYRYRLNGNYMLIIYYDTSYEEFDPNCTIEELRAKAIKHSTPGSMRYQSTTSSYVRDRYISEYAKRRANGICQLCDQPAPFCDDSGIPFLESHHVIWLGEGGSDSIDNTVALCPNCHRKMHVLNLNSDVEKLLKVVKDSN